MNEEKVQQFMQLLNGMTLREWEVFKRQIDLLYEVQSEAWRLKISPKAIEMFGNRTIEILNLVKPEIESTKKIFND